MLETAAVASKTLSQRLRFGTVKGNQERTGVCKSRLHNLIAGFVVILADRVVERFHNRVAVIAIVFANVENVRHATRKSL